VTHTRAIGPLREN